MPGAINSLRHWVLRQLQPAYEELPIEDGGYEEAKNDDQSGLLSSASSALSSPRRLSGHFTFAHRPPSGSTAGTFFWMLVLFPILLIRIVRRCVWSVWMAVYEQLGWFQVLVPTFCRPDDPGASRKLHPSAWLDGLRGMAALFVVFHHASLLWFSSTIHRGYASSENDPHRIIQLPFLRMLVSGRPQVAIFFVVSGYALSYKPLRLSRMGRYQEAGEAIHSAAFRRHPRLFLMPVIISFLAALMTHWNFYGTEGWENVAAPSRRPPRPETLEAQLSNWLINIRALTDPLSRNLQRGRPFAYDNNLWTLPIEFDCSLVVFLCQAAFNRLRPRVRMLLLLALVVYAHAYFHWEVFLFLSGMLLCDLHFHLDGTTTTRPEPPVTTAGAGAAATLAPPSPYPSSSASSASPFSFSFAVSRRRRLLCNLAGFVCFTAALYVLSLPDYADGWADTYGYQTLFQMVSARYAKVSEYEAFWLPPAAVLLVFATDRTPALQSLFTTPFAQYFGTISYSMYLVHGPLLWTFGRWVVRHTTAISGTETDLQYGLGIALCALLVWPVMIFLADLATRVLDKRAVNLGRWLYEWAVDKDTGATLPKP